MLTPQGHALGWDPARSRVAQAALKASGRYCKVSPSVPAPPPAFSLSGQCGPTLLQGALGTCWVHSACQLATASANALGYQGFPVSRRFVGYVGKQIEGGGNPDDGGDPTDSIAAMTVSQGGAGIPHESMWPYPPGGVSGDEGRAWLAAEPPANVYADARECHLVAPVVVESDEDARVLIASGHGCCNGIWWPWNFDDHHTVFQAIGPGAYGHSLYECGYVREGVWPGQYGRYAWWQWRNWHGRLYPPLPKQFADLVPGYAPDSPDWTSDLWVRDDVYQEIKAKGYFVRVSATDLTGFARNVVVPSADGVMIF